MKQELLEILECPFCGSSMRISEQERDNREIRRGQLACTGEGQHRFAICDGIVRFATGMNHLAVKKELAYENTTYVGSPRLKDPAIISRFPDTLAELWPHTVNFGPDFRALIECIGIEQGEWVLDIGTGPCWTSRLLAERGARVVALDVNEAEFYGLRTSDLLFDVHGIYFERILESMTCLPFAEETISRITFNASLHHTPNLRQTLRECKRVLKPDGLIGMVNEEFGSLRQLLFRNGPITDEGAHHRIPYSDFEDAAYENGLRIEYHVAEHVRRELKEKLTPRIGRLAAGMFELATPMLKQLNSALIILSDANTKSTARAGRRSMEAAYD